MFCNKLCNSILWAFAVAMLLLSCGTENSRGSHGTEGIAEARHEAMAEEAARDSLAYETRTFRAFSPHIATSEDGRPDSTIVTVSFPAFSPEINALVRESIFPEDEDSPEEMAASFLRGYDEYAEFERESERPDLRAWFMDLSCKVRLNTGQWLTLQNDIDSYTGGAHGMRVSVWASYDIAAKKKLTLDDLIWEPETLRLAAEKIFRKQENLSPRESLADGYFFENDEFSLPENFGLTPKGLLFYYNVYEIKPYMDGPTELLVPYSTFRDILTEKGTAIVKSLPSTNQPL